MGSYIPIADVTPAWDKCLSSYSFLMPYKGLGRDGGAEGDRTPDLRNAIATLSQLSYGPDP
jgi:hypothetical protein